MSKTKSNAIPHYELLYLISNKFSEDELAPIAEKINKMIIDNQGEITQQEAWGKKRLSYAIKGFIYGYYNLVEFNLAGEKLKDVERALRMASEILRHQIVKKKVLSAQQIAKDKKIAAKIAAKAEKEEKEVIEKEKTTEKEKINLEDLDKKLDKILDTDDLL